MVCQIFKNLVFCLAGPMEGQHTTANMARWCEIRKGVFLTEYNECVTHVLCTEEQFRQKTGPIKRALKNKKVAILDIAWFNECTATEKKPNKNEYDMRNILRREKIEKQKINLRKKQEREQEIWVPSNTFRILQDRENFSYEVELTREVEDNGNTEKYVLYLFQSIAKKPHAYRFAIKFWQKKGATPKIHRQKEPDFGVPFGEVWPTFLHVFKLKTGINWCDRVLKAGTMDKSFFQYWPPTRGKPVGVGLCLPLQECLKRNAELRGLAWPPVEIQPQNETQQQDRTEQPGDVSSHHHSEDDNADASIGDSVQPKPVEVNQQITFE